MKAELAQPFGQFQQFQRQMFDIAMQVNQIAMGHAGQLIKLNSTLANEYLSRALEHAKTLGRSDDLPGLMKAYSSILSDNAARAIEDGRRYMDFALQAQNELREVVQRSFDSLKQQKEVAAAAA